MTSHPPHGSRQASHDNTVLLEYTCIRIRGVYWTVRYVGPRATESTYPPPSPPPTMREDLFQKQDFVALDQMAKQAPANLVNSFSELIVYLTKDMDNDLHKVRSIFVWLSAQSVLTTNFPKVVKPDTPLNFLKRCKLDREIYTDLFAVLCRKAGVPCVIIEGTTKGAGWEVGDQCELAATNRWNAVHVQNSWRLVNVPWALVTTGDLEQDNWIKVEEDGRAVRERETVDSFVHQDMDEFWFLPDPENMVCFCFPKDPRWQLLSEPWSQENFISTPRYAQEFMGSQWELVSAAQAVLEADEGKCKITFSHPRDVKGTLHYNLFFNPKLSNVQLPEDLQLDRYVVEECKLGLKSVVTRLPVKGVYRIQLAGSFGENELTPLLEFRINCVGEIKQPVPFPEGCKQVGYSEESAELGLVEPSHEEGVVETRKGEKISFQFKLKDKKPAHIKATLINNNRSTEELSQYVTCERTKEDINITVTMPDVQECGLCIENASIPDYDISYLLTQDSKLKFKEQEPLEKAMKTEDVLELKYAIAAYEQQMGDDKATLHLANLILHLLQALKDDSSWERLEGALRPLLSLTQEDYGHGERAVRTLMKQYEKAVCEAYYQRSLAALEQAVTGVHASCLAAQLQQQDFYTRAVTLQTQLQQLQRVVRDVRSLTSLDLAALVNTRGRPNPHLHSTLMATLILLGEEEKELWAELAAHHVRQCQVDLLRKENSACAALLLEWPVRACDWEESCVVAYGVCLYELHD
ncbi:hypothetical protein C0Q70_17305 [Pomacea canaliculata]|uniref:KY-like immunoglobulin-like domain-containing protein n=1 Tax=Pomacea canaliculata TaxID=400727 RepID=A0A2T7NK09_POMCA|nr:hypothetical protein C0Q70_17305 [Pomacea canaliculata]